MVSRRAFLVTVDAAELPFNAKLMNVPSMCLVGSRLEYLSNERWIVVVKREKRLWNVSVEGSRTR